MYMAHHIKWTKNIIKNYSIIIIIYMYIKSILLQLKKKKN